MSSRLRKARAGRRAPGRARVAYATPGVLYELPIDGLTLDLGAGVSLDVTDALSSGRANYILFQSLVARCAGWLPGTEGGDSDLRLPDGRSAEAKAYYDDVAYPSAATKFTRIHTAASSTFGPNNKGPMVKRLLSAGDYTTALAVCRESGYDKNDFYVYTNTRGFTAGQPLRYLIVPTSMVLANLSTDDPREIDRAVMLGLATSVQRIDPATIVGR